MVVVAAFIVHFWACAYILAAYVPNDQSQTWLQNAGVVEFDDAGKVTSAWWVVYCNSVYFVITTVSGWLAGCQGGWAGGWEGGWQGGRCGGFVRWVSWPGRSFPLAPEIVVL